MDVAIITIAVIVIHVWRTMMEEIYRMSAPVYRERSGCSDRDDALDGMSIAMAYVPWQSWRHITKPEKDSTEEPYSKSLIFRLRGKEDVTHE